MSSQSEYVSHMSTHVPVHVHMCVQMHAHAYRGQRSILCIIMVYFLTYFGGTMSFIEPVAFQFS